MGEAEGSEHRVAPSTAVAVVAVVADHVGVGVVPRVDGEGGGCGRRRLDGHHGGRGTDDGAAEAAEGGAEVEAAAQEVAAPTAAVGVGVHKLSGLSLVQVWSRQQNLHTQGVSCALLTSMELLVESFSIRCRQKDHWLMRSQVKT